MRDSFPTNWRVLTKGDSSSMPDKVLKHKCYPHWYYKHVVEKGRKECTVFARRLCELVGVSTEKMCNINEIQLFERLLNLQILVISSKLGNKFIRIGENEPIRKKVFLYLVEQDEFQHFTAIVSLTGFFTCNYFCSTCLKPYNDKDQHSCETTCTVCCSSCCIHTSSTMSCRTCNRLCRSQECFLKHAEKKQTRKGGSLPSECEKRYQCKICKKLLDWDDRPPTVHQCGEWKCPCCKEYYTGEHLCYQRKIVNELNDNIMIFFDTETKQDSLLQCKNGYNPTDTTCEKCTNQDKKCGKCKLCQTCNKSWCGSREHTVNFICMQTACNHCQEKPILQTTKCFYCGVRCSLCSQREKNAFKGGPCVNTCGFRMRLFKDSKATDEFCRIVFSDQYKNSILLSHNGSGYDNYFLLEWLLTNSIRPEIIFSGSKIMYMLVRRGLNIKVLDSLNFLPMKLSKIPKAFGLKELKKGYFPLFFNTEDNQAYVGPYPHARYYGADYMNTSDRENFLIWYETRKNKVFNFAQEMEEYCVSDTSILREGLIKFRNLMLQVTGTEMETTDSETGEPKITYPGGVDPLDYVTIATGLRYNSQRTLIH
ncbi:unnamed protein product [Mytilus edulis]|uniref:DNA-directed DNA polymerase n=1 Tax=Mytilus edulis TaxID=6550 RepID=A0A8S3S1I4_MYTED|nr:unnamed protein product [Mytilus edulis]